MRWSQGFAGSNPLKFMKQYKDAGVTLPVIGGGTAGDDALLKSFGDEAIGADHRVGLHLRSRHAESTSSSSPAWSRDYRRHTRPVCRRPLHQRHGGRGGAEGDRRQDRRQGGVHQGAARGVARPTRRAGRSTSTISAMSSATSTSAGWSARTASWCKPRSRPIRTSASSGPSTRSGSWSSRSIRATIRR